MPQLSDEEIKAKIADGSISAITIDTVIFDRYQCDLEFAILRKLDQFHDGNIDVLFSEIVANEVEAHIARDAAETQRSLRKAITAHVRRWKLTAKQGAAPASFLLGNDPSEIASRQFADFVAAVGADIVPAAVSAEVAREVLRRYFAAEAPFEASEKKKNEFPDAFALISLEAWADNAGKMILCVSADKGWSEFASQSVHLVCIDDLDKALSFFNDAGRVVADQVMALLRAGASPEVISPIESAFEYRLDDNDFHVDGWSSVEFDTEALGATLQHIDWQTASVPTVVASDEDTVTFTFKVDAKIGFEANFSFAVRDSVDRDYVSLGSEDVYKEETFTFELALTVSREVDPEPEVFEAEVAKRFIEVNFGTVEPFRSENPFHEKY